MREIEVVLSHEGAELTRMVVPPGEYIIGRGEGAAIRADTPLISRKHACLTVDKDECFLQDLGSSNGTFVSGESIADSTRISEGQRIGLGNVQMEIRDVSHTEGTQATIRRHLPDAVLSGGRYSVSKEIARGGMGAILQAQQAAMKRRVAMKVMLNAQNESDVLRFIEEAQITGQLEHPSIVPIYELGVDEQEQLFYTMKLVRGITLRKVLELLGKEVAETVKKFPLPVLLTIFQKTCDAIAFAHSKNVIHRDLKPENIMLGDFGEVLVMDWGLAKILSKSEGQIGPLGIERTMVASARTGGDIDGTMDGTVMGTPQYMAPEQARGEIDNLDGRADIYALGAILFHILYLRPCVSGRTAMEIVDKVQRGELDWTKPRIEVPESLMAITRKALALAPEDRYQHVDALQRDIEAYQSGFATSAEERGAWKELKLWVRRNRNMATGVAAVLLVGVTFGGRAVVEGRRAEREAVRAIAEAARANDALDALRKTAPTFADQARIFSDQGRFAQGLEQINAAVALSPDNPQFLLAKAEILQASERWNEARIAFGQARKAGAKSAYLDENERISSEVVAAAAANQEVPPNAWVVLASSYRAQKRGSAYLAISASKNLSTNGGEFLAAWQAKLNAFLGQSAPKFAVGDAGSLFLSCQGTVVSSLEPLRGCPLSGLNVSYTTVTDLEPLAGMPLRWLDISGLRISDLKQLRGLHLRNLKARDLSTLVDLSPLAGMPLTSLELKVGLENSRSPRIVDLTPLKGAPLVHLDLERMNVDSIEPLRGMQLQGLAIGDTLVVDLSPIEGAPITSVTLTRTKVANLEPLRNAPITVFNAYGTEIEDLSPLSGKALDIVNVGGCKKLRDLSVLVACPTLREIMLPPNGENIEKFRGHPQIQRISYAGNSLTGQPSMTAAEFWKEFDAKKAGPKR